MRNISIALISAVLVLALGGCGSDKYDYNKIADAIKSQGYECRDLRFDYLLDNKMMTPYKDDILKMNHLEFDKLIKAMNCDFAKYSIKAQLEKAKKDGDGDIIEHIEKMGK
jgi:hypothetical protein